MIWLGIWYLVIGWVLLFVKVCVRSPSEVNEAPVWALITTAFLSPVWPLILYGPKR
jgi:hypothetical protein